MSSKRKAAANAYFKPLDQKDSYTEGIYHWKASAALPRRLLFKSKFWKILKEKKIDSYKQKLTKNERRVFENILIEEMHLWTTFIHLDEKEREVLWLVELSEIFKQEEETKLDYVKKHSSSQLADFIEERKIVSCNQLVREIWTPDDVGDEVRDNVTNRADMKVEFMLKRIRAKKSILQKINHLRALLKIGASYQSAMFASKRWIRFQRVGNRTIRFKKDDVIYVAEVVNYDGEEPSMRCYQGRVSGVKIVEEQVAYYHVYFENSTIDKVHEESVLSNDEYQELAADVALMMKQEKIVEEKK